MKKFLALILVLVLALSVFAGCNKKDDDKDNESEVNEEPKDEVKENDYTLIRGQRGPRRNS